MYVFVKYFKLLEDKVKLSDLIFTICFSYYLVLFLKSDARYFIVKIKCHGDFITVFWTNSYFMFQMHHAKIFKMRYSRSLYKLFWKYESWVCSEVSKTHFSKYSWNHAFAGMKKNTLTDNTGTPPITRFSYNTVFYLTQFF